MISFKRLALFACICPAIVAGQELQRLELQQAYDLAEKNYPAIKQKDLIHRTASITIANLQTGFLPQLTFSGQASYQSDVTHIDIALPGLTIPSPDKDQYKLVADVSQVLYDGGLTHQQKNLQRLNEAAEMQKVEVQLYQVREKVSQLFLTALYLEQQLEQIDLVKSDISIGIKRMEAQVQNGTGMRSGLNMLKAELLKTDQRGIEIRASKKGVIDALVVFLGQPVAEDPQLIIASIDMPLSDVISRPELKLFDQQATLLGGQSKLINARDLPKASLFVQGGYGKPGLNLLQNGFDFFYIGGLRLSWALGGLYTKKKDKELVQISKQTVDIQRETFVLNTNSQLKQQLAEISKYRQLIQSDSEIVILRKSVTDAAKAQLENAVITPTDYLDQVNAEDQARQSLILHRVQLLQAQVNYQSTLGKQ